MATTRCPGATITTGRRLGPLLRSSFFSSQSNANTAELTRRLDFSDTQKALQSKSNFELWRAYTVFKLFQYDVLVDNSEKLLTILRRLLGKTIFSKLMRATIFGQFIAGEDVKGVQLTLDKLRSQGVLPVLAYSAEEDTTGIKSKSTKKTTIDSVERTFDSNIDLSIGCVNTVADLSEHPFSATKLTGFCRNTTMMQLSEAVLGSEKVFFLLADQPDILEGRITEESFIRGAERMKLNLSEGKVESLWQNMKSSDKVNFFDWNDHFLSDNSEIYSLLAGKLAQSPLQLHLPIMSNKEKEQYDSFMGRVERLAHSALERGVRLMVDAEETFYQPAIRHIAVHCLMPKYNMVSPIIYNTQQCYLKNSFREIVRDFAASEHYGCKFAVKTVRGAYLTSERALALKKGYEDPIWATKPETDASYHRVLSYVLEKVKKGQGNVMVATHNGDTVNFALEKIASLQLNTRDSSVAFGQQFGMSDNITLTLGASGYMAYKYILYGPLDEVFPYLIRRAHENKGVLAGAVRERSIIRREIKRRQRPNRT